MSIIEPVAFVDQTLHGAHTLLKSTHDYIKWQAPLDIEKRGYQETFKVSCEAMRVTVRMTQIIAWLMLQKAVLEGDLTREEVLSDEYQVLRGKTCLESSSESDAQLPPRLRELLKESREFYLRILRLDKLSRKQVLSGPKPHKKPMRLT
jgi:regulator of CtrA degradation